MPDVYGLRVYNDTGGLRLDVTDRITRLLFTYDYLNYDYDYAFSTGGSSYSKHIAVPEMALWNPDEGGMISLFPKGTLGGNPTGWSGNPYEGRTGHIYTVTGEGYARTIHCNHGNTSNSAMGNYDSRADSVLLLFVSQDGG